MQCISCKTTLSPSFKHALAQNMCPACGGPIMDEESLALIEDVRGMLSSEATLRDETSHKLAMAIVARYDISLRDTSQSLPQVSKKSVAMKIAPPSAAQQMAKHQQDAMVISAKELENNEISEKERDAMMADAVSKHYNMVDTISGETLVKGYDVDADILQGAFVGENDENPILERERIMRLKKQQMALSSGVGSFRRSS